MRAPDNGTKLLETADTAGRPGLVVRVWRRRTLVTLVFCIVMSITLAALVVLPVRYLASGSVIIAEQEPSVRNTSEAWAQKVGDPADLESQLLVIRSPRLLRVAMARPGALEAVHEECRHDREQGALGWLVRLVASPCDKLKPDSEALIGYVGSRYRIGGVGRSRVINIAYLSARPEVAQQLTNALITVFLDDQRANLSTGREAAAAWLWQELRQLDLQVRDQDAEIQAFRRAKGLTRGSLASITSERLTSMSQQLSAAEAARAEAAARLQEINTDPARAAAVLASRIVADLKQQMSIIGGQLANSASALGPNHPTLRALQREHDSLQQRLAAEIASITASARKTYEAANALVASLMQQMEVLKTEFASAAAHETSIESMVRSADIKRQGYADLYKRASELESERRLLLGSARLISMAELPERPFFPKPIPFLAVGFVVAALLAFAAALLRDRSDHRVAAPSDLTETTGAPILAHLPRLTGGRIPPALGLVPNQQNDMPLALALKDAARDPVLQSALRKLHAGVALAGCDKRLRSILVTSAGAREGRTFTTLALAQLVAATGARVLAVEGDMRSPAFAEALDLPSSPGLAGLLKGTAHIREIVVRTAVPNLDAIPAGQSTTDATDLLKAKQLSDLLRWAQGYNLVLVDSPPSATLTDACMLAKHVDGVLCCTLWGNSSLAAAAVTVSHIRAAGGDVFGTAITMVRADHHAPHEAAPAPAFAHQGAA